MREKIDSFTAPKRKLETLVIESTVEKRAKRMPDTTVETAQGTVYNRLVCVSKSNRVSETASICNAHSKTSFVDITRM